MKQQFTVTGEKVRGLKLISWILAYAVWIFIFLIPVIGIVLILMYLSRNRAQQGGKIIIDSSEAPYKKLKPGP
ncbi:MAG: hypothetical protein PHY03_04210 [Dehalococcoidia bacterium]|nr:hypothetical protein [Dehalococcoidia bacterium]